ncbi:hypothetical protein MRX96_031739 [Rhipicephalus microplus]
MLLAASAESHKSNAQDDLPSYFLNPDVLAFEAKIRVGDSVEAMEGKLSEIQEISDRASLMRLQKFVLPKTADPAVVTTALEHGNKSSPDILNENGNFKISCKENIVALPPASSSEKAVLLLTVFFMLNLPYLYAFWQFLGLEEIVVVKDEPFDN